MASDFDERTNRVEARVAVLEDKFEMMAMT